MVQITWTVGVHDREQLCQVHSPRSVARFATAVADAAPEPSPGRRDDAVDRSPRLRPRGWPPGTSAAPRPRRGRGRCRPACTARATHGAAPPCLVAQLGVDQVQVVMRRDVFGVEFERPLELRDRLLQQRLPGVLPFGAVLLLGPLEQRAAQFVDHFVVQAEIEPAFAISGVWSSSTLRKFFSAASRCPAGDSAVRSARRWSTAAPADP